MLAPVRAELVPLTDSAVLRCGCTGVVLSHDLALVHFGIEQPGCPQHTNGNIAVVDKSELVMPTKIAGG